MRSDTLDVLRCPYCGGRLELVTDLFHRVADNHIRDGILGCHCCIFPVIDGIPVLHLQSAVVEARQEIESGRPAAAVRKMFELEDEGQGERFETAAASPASTYRDIVDALGPKFEGGYFLYRFSDPTYLVAEAVVRAVAGTVLSAQQRAVDVCGGSGHLTRALLDYCSAPPILADLFFAKAWLARRFTAPGCEAVCCDGNAPLPFARGAFGYAMCSDAFQYIWTKRQFIGELTRLIDGANGPGAIVISHTHNQLAWSPSHGQPLSPSGYRDLFETLEPRIFGEAGLLADVVGGGSLDLSRQDPETTLDADPALTLIATKHPAVFRSHALAKPATVARGEFRVNPLYTVQEDGSQLHLRLCFPSVEYEDEYKAARRYLPDEAVIDKAGLHDLQFGLASPAVTDLIRRRVIVDLPRQYY